MSNTHWVCFKCRISFKDWHNKKCPNCSESLFNAGPAFKTPGKNQKYQWRKVELLIRNGVFFYNDGLYRNGNKVFNESAKTLRNAKDLLKPKCPSKWESPIPQSHTYRYPPIESNYVIESIERLIKIEKGYSLCWHKQMLKNGNVRYYYE